MIYMRRCDMKDVMEFATIILIFSIIVVLMFEFSTFIVSAWIFIVLIYWVIRLGIFVGLIVKDWWIG